MKLFCLYAHAAGIQTYVPTRDKRKLNAKGRFSTPADPTNVRKNTHPGMSNSNINNAGVTYNLRHRQTLSAQHIRPRHQRAVRFNWNSTLLPNRGATLWATAMYNTAVHSTHHRADAGQATSTLRFRPNRGGETRFMLLRSREPFKRYIALSCRMAMHTSMYVHETKLHRGAGDSPHSGVHRRCYAARLRRLPRVAANVVPYVFQRSRPLFRAGPPTCASALLLYHCCNSLFSFCHRHIHAGMPYGLRCNEAGAALAFVFTKNFFVSLKPCYFFFISTTKKISLCFTRFKRKIKDRQTGVMFCSLDVLQHSLTLFCAS